MVSLNMEKKNTRCYKIYIHKFHIVLRLLLGLHLKTLAKLQKRLPLLFDN